MFCYSYYGNVGEQLIRPSEDCRAVQELAAAETVLEFDVYLHIPLYSAYVIAKG